MLQSESAPFSKKEASEAIETGIPKVDNATKIGYIQMSNKLPPPSSFLNNLFSVL